ncbi:MAG: efflux RND transporter periplasmic adaptor subunit [Marinovum sp.]|nr:efflux RND transporter periplasmic adaptor subunit [Marinovum sp.]
MRLIPILTAVLVSALLISIVLFRETLLGFAATPPWSAPDTTAEAPLPDESVAPVEEVAEAAEKAPEATLVHVMATRSAAQIIDSALVIRGETEAARQVNVQAETSSTVISEPLRKGASVEAGQLLCELDPGTRGIGVAEAVARLAEAQARVPETQARIPEAEARIPEAEARIPEAQARLIEAHARLDEAEVNYNAALRLQEDGFASETRVKNAEAAVRSAEAGIIATESTLISAEASVKTAQAGLEAARAGLDSTKAGIQSAEAAVAAAKKEMERLRIVAPFAGVLESDTAELGALLRPGSLCATVLQMDPIKLVGFVPETEVSRVEIGANATARLATGERVSGQVSFLAKSGDAQTRTFRVEIEVPNPELAIRDGQTAEIVISAPGNSAHLLPQSALTLNDQGDMGVRYVADGNVVGFAPVTVLRDTREGVWLAGLPDEVAVITLGQEFVVAGVPVRVTYAGEQSQ